VSVRPVLDRSPRFADLLRTDPDEGTGRPVGNAGFIADLERRLGRPIAKRPAGRKPKAATPDQPDLHNFLGRGE